MARRPRSRKDASPRPEADGDRPQSWPTVGGRLCILSDADMDRIHEASLRLMGELGFAEAPPEIVDLVCGAGGSVSDSGRLCFSEKLVEEALAHSRARAPLHARDGRPDLALQDGAVHFGTGGAAPLVRDMETGLCRPSMLADLYDAARLADCLEHVHFFSRSLIARDIAEERALDVNTCYASLAGTTKHVMVSASQPAHVADIAGICAMLAGSAEEFRGRPFLSLNINHVAPPMRFAPDAALVLVEAARAGIPCMVNTFAQLGASSPVTMAGCLAQTNAETLAGMCVAWLAAPGAPAIYGGRAMVTDLRTGAMAGGSGEQALVAAAMAQMARHYGLPSSTIAGATDSKAADAQAGYEKALAVSMAAQAGANLITQAAGTQAGLMATSFEACVIDNEMIGAVLRSLAPLEVEGGALAPEGADAAILGEGHFLGHPDTHARMKSDFLYPDLADRRPIAEWEEDGSPDIRVAAAARAREILATHHPKAIPPEADAEIRRAFDIRLPAG